MVGMNVRRCTPPFPRASGAGLMLVLFSLLLALHCVETGPVAALHHRDCSQQASACLWLRGGRGDSALEQRETIRKALSKKAAETESIFGMSSGEDDSSALADPLDDLGLSESEDPDLRDPLQTVRVLGDNLCASVFRGKFLVPLCIVHAAAACQVCLGTLTVALMQELVDAAAAGKFFAIEVIRMTPSLPPLDF